MWLSENVPRTSQYHYENTPIQIYRKFQLEKLENFLIKNSDLFHISAQNIDCGYSLEPPRRGGSNEYPQSMFLSRYKKNNVYPCKPQFYYIKVGFKGVKIIWVCFRDESADYSFSSFGIIEPSLALKTEYRRSPIFVLLCVLYFQRKLFRFSFEKEKTKRYPDEK